MFQWHQVTTHYLKSLVFIIVYARQSNTSHTDTQIRPGCNASQLTTLLCLTWKLLLSLSDHSPLRSAVSASPCTSAISKTLSELFHPSTGAPAPSVQGLGSPCAPLSCINKLLIRGDILSRRLGLPAALSHSARPHWPVSMCESQKAPVMDTRRQLKPTGIEGTGYFCVLLLVSLCFDNRVPPERRGSASWIVPDIRALGLPRGPLPFTPAAWHDGLFWSGTFSQASHPFCMGKHKCIYLYLASGMKKPRIQSTFISALFLWFRLLFIETKFYGRPRPQQEFSPKSFTITFQ